MFRFTIRDVLWLTVVVALAVALSVGWWRSQQDRQEISRLLTILKLEEHKSDKLMSHMERSSADLPGIAQLEAARTIDLVEAIDQRIEKLKAEPSP